MSQIFYESDNLTIVGGYGRLIGSCSNGWAETNNKNWVISQKTIRLHFTIHVNGKLKTFFQEYPLAKSKDFWLAWEESEELTLENYDSWNSVIEILRSMGYADDLKSFSIKEWCQWAISE
jgi:hypothetical protein